MQMPFNLEWYRAGYVIEVKDLHRIRGLKSGLQFYVELQRKKFHIASSQ